MFDPTSNAKYKKKYVKMKRMIKDMVFENAALCDQVSTLQEKVMIAKEEQRFLLKKLNHFQALSDLESGITTAKSRGGTASNSPQSISALPAPPLEQGTSPVTPQKPPAKKRKSNAGGSGTEPMRAPARSSGSRKGKQKRFVQPIPLDATGRPMFPIILGGLTVFSLGEVITDKSTFCTEDLIYPVGFCSTRVYGSLRNPEKKCIYTCKVLDGGHAPKFEIASDNDVGIAMTGATPDACLEMLISHIHASLKFEVVSASGRGADFFGLSTPTIHNLIQCSTGARKCPGYRNVKFEVNRSGDVQSDPLQNDPALSYEGLLSSIARVRLSKIKSEPLDPFTHRKM